MTLANVAIWQVVVTLMVCAAAYAIQRLVSFLWSVREFNKLSFPGPPQHWLFGNIPDIAGKPVHQILYNWTLKFRGSFRVRFMNAKLLVLMDPKLIPAVLKTGPLFSPKYPGFYTLFETLTRPHRPSMLTSPEGAYWKAVRKAVAASFTTTNLKQIFQDVVNLSNRVGDHLQAEGPQAVQNVDLAAQRLTIDVIGRVAFGIDMRATEFQPHSELQVVSNLLKALQTRINILNRIRPWCKEECFARKALTEFDQLADDIIRRSRGARQQSPSGYVTALQRLEETIDPATGQPLEYAKLKSEAALLLVGGFETTAHTIAWTLLCLACHPEAEQQVARELGELGLLATPGAPRPRSVSWSDLGRMRQLDAAINEAMRLFPAASGGTARKASTDMVTSEGITIPKGTALWLPTYSIHRHPDIWGPSANEYNPQRWLSSSHSTGASNGAVKSGAADDDVDKAPAGPGVTAAPEYFTAAAAEEGASAGSGSGSTSGPSASGGGDRCFLPFSQGPRDCVGQSLAMLELRVALATLLGRFTFKLPDSVGGFKALENAARQHVTLKPMVPGPVQEFGLLMHVTPRVL